MCDTAEVLLELLHSADEILRVRVLARDGVDIASRVVNEEIEANGTAEAPVAHLDPITVPVLAGCVVALDSATIAGLHVGFASGADAALAVLGVIGDVEAVHTADETALLHVAKIADIAMTEAVMPDVAALQ